MPGAPSFAALPRTVTAPRFVPLPIPWRRRRPPARRVAVDPWTGAVERRRTLWRRMTPPQLFVSSFLLLIAAGTLGLRLVPGFHAGAALGWLDALFTATSAVCVTGLTVVDTATAFTPAGQAFLLVLIQLGGLGMIAFATLIILALGRRLSLRHEGLGGPSTEIVPYVRPERLARDVVYLTLGTEAVGAVLLYLLWAPKLGWAGAAWPAVFHSVSAFCNAGFSTFSDSLIGFQRSPGTLTVVALLIVVGGIGFLTIEELTLRLRRHGTRRLRLSLHSRLVLVTTAALLAGGWALFALLEWRHALGALGTGDRLVNAFFLSVTARTAGFNVIDYGAATDSANFLTVILMFVGGSPGSTAGGIKTTTMALVALLAWDRYTGAETTDVWDRSIPAETVQRAVGLLVVAAVAVTISVFVLSWTEGATPIAGSAADRRFLATLFEVVSAFNTVGLSMNLTPQLSAPGKLFTALLMFVGRVGPITFAAAVTLAPRRRESFRYAYEDVVTG